MFNKSTALGCLRQAKDGNELLTILDVIAEEVNTQSDEPKGYQELTDVNIL